MIDLIPLLNAHKQGQKYRLYVRAFHCNYEKRNGRPAAFSKNCRSKNLKCHSSICAREGELLNSEDVNTLKLKATWNESCGHDQHSSRLVGFNDSFMFSFGEHESIEEGM